MDYPDENYLPGPQLKTGELWAPLDISAYGSGPKRNTGFFVQYDYLFWSIDRPDVTTVPIGAFEIDDPFLSPPVTLDTSPFSNGFDSGSRGEIGWTDGCKGFFVSGFHVNALTQNASGGNSFDTHDGAGITYGTVDYDIEVENRSSVWSGEIMATYRLPRGTPPMAYEPQTEFMGGIRYFRFEDQFLVNSKYRYDDLGLVGGPILGEVGDGFSDTVIENDLIGPQIGIRHSQRAGVFEGVFEGRAMLAYNMASARSQSSVMTIGDPTLLGEPFSFNQTVVSSQHYTELMPLLEVRANAKWNVTRLVHLEAGWSCVWIGNGIARAAQAIDPDTYILRSGPKMEDLFMHGFNLGFVVNR
jgi:hypothetical protein